MQRTARQLLVLCWAILPVLAAPAADPADLAAVAAARRELGHRHWSAALAIRNTRPGRPYPAVTHGLAFEFVDALWFYCPTDGTRPLSLRQHEVEADKAALRTLLRRIDRGFVAWRELTPEELATVAPADKPLPNGCFVESVGEARRRAEAGELGEARLLSYYVGREPHRQGHTVLCFENDDGTQVYDPADGTVRRLFGRLRSFSPAALAERLLSTNLSARLTGALVILLGRGA